MNEPLDEKLRSLLSSAFPPGGEPREDLWPRMLDRLNRRETRWSWFDFALGGSAAAVLAAFPQVIPWVLFHC